MSNPIKLDTAILDRYRVLSTSTVSDALDKLGLATVSSLCRWPMCTPFSIPQKLSKRRRTPF
jgi:hypothetical protein